MRLTIAVSGYSAPMTVPVIRIVRVGAWAIVGTLALLGLVTAGHTVVVPVVVAPVAGGLVGWALARYRSASLSQTCTAILGGAATAGVGVLAIAGLVLLMGPAAVLILPAFAGLLVWLHRQRSPRGEATTVGPDGPPLSGLTNVQLARGWQTSYAELTKAADATALERICVLRRRQLDEIERRDPEGFHRWISTGYWVRGDSAPFLGG
jgi:hypothetical protein